MTQYHSEKVKLSISQLNKLKSCNKKFNWRNSTITTKRYWCHESNFPRSLLLADRQISTYHKAFPNNFSLNIKLSETELSKIIRSGSYLGRLLELLIKVGLPLINNVLTSLANRIAVALVADLGIHKNLWNL